MDYRELYNKKVGRIASMQQFLDPHVRGLAFAAARQDVEDQQRAVIWQHLDAVISVPFDPQHVSSHTEPTMVLPTHKMPRMG